MSEIAEMELTARAAHHPRRNRRGARETLLKVGDMKEIYAMKGAGRSGSGDRARAGYRLEHGAAVPELGGSCPVKWCKRVTLAD